MAVSDLPRLLLCCFDVVPAPTAISRRITEYVKGLSDRFQVVALTVKTPDHTHIERYQGARLLRVPVGSGDLAARVQSFDRAVRRQLESEEYVMVHAFDPFGGYALAERRDELGYKLVYDACALPSVDLPFLHDEAETNRRFIAKVRRQELFCLMNADAVVVGNDLTRDYVAGLGVAREQVLVLPPPVDLTPYVPEVMGTPDATPMRLLHLGNLSTANDFSTLLEAMAQALQRTDVMLTIVGPRHPSHQARLEEQIAALKLTGKVEFQDPVGHDDVHKVLATVDVGLLTLSDVERNSRVGSPLSRAGEYLAAGRPIIAADVASARALLSDEGVLFYKPGDVTSLADALIELANDPTRRLKLGQAAKEAAKVHDAVKLRADLVALYVSLTGTGIREVGDAETTSPDEVTQLGRSNTNEDTNKNKQVAANVSIDGSAPPELSSADTSPEVAGDAERPAVMGVPIREDEPPIVLGQEAREIAAEFAQVTTEPNALRPTDPPVVMGTPVAPPRPPPPVPSPPPPAPNPLDVAALESGSPPLADDLPDTGSHLSLVRDAGEATPAPAISAPPPVPTTPIAEPVRPEPPPMPIARPSVPEPPVAPPPPPRPAVAASRSGQTPIFVPPLEMPALGPVTSPSGVSAPPPAPRTSVAPAASVPPPLNRPAPAPSVPTFVPLLTPPPVLKAQTGATPVFSPPPQPPPMPGRTTTGSFPVVPAPRTATGSFPVVPMQPPPRTTTGSFPVIPAGAPPRTSTGSFPVVPVTASTRPSGLFPEAPRVPSAGEVEAIGEDEIQEVTDDSEVSADEVPEELDSNELVEVPSQESVAPRLIATAAQTSDDAPEMADEGLLSVESDAAPPDSAIDAWLAMAVHGYCPPESDLFNRHTPPTTMPGRDT